MRCSERFRKKSKNGEIPRKISLPLGCHSDKIKIKKLVAEGAALQKLIKIPGIADRRPASEKHLRVAAYCRVSIRQEE